MKRIDREKQILSRKTLILLLLAITPIVAERSAFHVAGAENQSNAKYRIKPGDILSVKVMGSDYDDTVEVDIDGMIKLAFTDDAIEAAGKTVNELRDAAVIQLKKIFKNPAVEIRLLKKRT